MTAPEEWNEETPEVEAEWRRADEPEWTPPPGISDWNPKDFVVLTEGARPIPVTDPIVQRARVRRIVYVSSGAFIAIGIALIGFGILSRSKDWDRPKSQAAKTLQNSTMGPTVSQAMSAIRAGDLKTALDLFRRILSAGTVPAGEEMAFLQTYGDCALLLGEIDLAIEIYEKTISSGKGTVPPEVLNNIAYVLMDRGVALPMSEMYVRRALESDPDSPNFLDTLGCIQLKVGQIAEGRETLKKAAEKGPQGIESSPIYEHLGDAFYLENDGEQAVYWWRRAATSDPSNQRVWKKLTSHAGEDMRAQ